MTPFAIFLVSVPGERSKYDYGSIIDTAETWPGHPRSETIISVRGQHGIWHLFAASAYVVDPDVTP